jgi:hypothetical protein
VTLTTLTPVFGATNDALKRAWVITIISELPTAWRRAPLCARERIAFFTADAVARVVDSRSLSERESSERERARWIYYCA